MKTIDLGKYAHFERICATMKNESALAIRSKQLIAKALVELMKEMPIDKITIVEIINKALLARRTFYSHFSTKEDVLRYLIRSEVENYLTDIIKAKVGSRYEIGLVFFRFIKKLAGSFKVLQNDFADLMITEFENILSEHPDIISTFTRFGGEGLSVYDEHYIVGGTWYITKVWVRNNCDKSPEHMAEVWARQGIV